MLTPPFNFYYFISPLGEENLYLFYASNSYLLLAIRVAGVEPAIQFIEFGWDCINISI
nr:MAG TPA: hypothetical protein [Caudoviricetes sp.]